MNNRGYSLVELILAIGMSAIVLGAIMLSFTGTSRVFSRVKSISDNIQTKTPSIELVARYFDRWGVGVASRNDFSACRSCETYSTDCCPPKRKYIKVTNYNDCSDVTFFGNIHGFGFVKGPDPMSNPSSIISCRLNSYLNSQNCYMIWRDNIPLNNLSGDYISPLQLDGLDSSEQNLECLTLTATTSSNATINSTQGGITLKAGDFIQRFPHRIRLYCDSNTSDANRKWLYVDLTDTSSSCNENEIATAIAPVDNFQVTPLPSGCNALEGECTAVSVDIVFRSQTQQIGGQYDQYRLTKVFGR